MSDYLDSILNFLSPEAGQARRRKLDLALMELIPPEMRPQLGLVAEMNPVVSMERAGTAAGRVANPSLSGWERMAAAGDTLSNMAGVVGPAAAARRVGMPVANAVQETLLGMAMSPEAVAAKNVGNAVVERLNQPGPMPTTYSNPIFGGMKLYRGDTGSSERITNGIGEGLLFGTPYEDVARLYGNNISQFELPDGARVLTEGSKEFSKVTGRKKGPLLRNLRPGENLTSAANEAIERARAAGYDAVEFNSMRDMGVAVLNPSIVRSAPTDPAIQRAGELLSPPPTAFDDWIDSFYTAEARKARSEGRGEPLVKPDIVYRGVSPQELENAVREGAFRANGAGVFVEPDPTRYVGGGAYGAKNQGAILQFDVSGLPKREMTGGIGTGDTLGYDAIPFDRVKMAWFWDANKKAHVLRPINE